MATVISDFFADPFHTMIATSTLQHQHEPHYGSTSRQRDAPASRRPSASPRSCSRTESTPSLRYPAQQERQRGWEAAAGADAEAAPETSTSAGASRFPSPPESSSPDDSVGGDRPQHGNGPAYMAPTTHEPARVASTSTPLLGRQQSQPAHSIPSPPDDFAFDPSSERQGQTIHVRDLAHIQSLARGDSTTGNGPGILHDPPLQAMKYEISGMPIGDIIEMVAALLTKITTTNDLQHDALHRNAAHQQHAAQAQAASGEGGYSSSHMSPLSSSVLAFHGKNVPAITILSYLSRIHKYCPTTYEVFLSLLVYFDRMTERVNDLVMKSEEARRQQRPAANQTPAPGAASDEDTEMRDDEDSEASGEADSDLADDDDGDVHINRNSSSSRNTRATETASGGATGTPAATTAAAAAAAAAAANQIATYFVVDSFNIHRLIIAGVTCASKFFSDVFYTNSRYAKVGGLPLPELNHLELQFLLLNDFRLAVPVEDLEAYATMLVEFYAREVVAQPSQPETGLD